jgi:hypothetical protein
MGLSCGASCAKYILFAFNIIFFLGGAAVLGVGIWVLVSTGTFVDVLEQFLPAANLNDITNNPLANNVATIHTAAYILIGVGSFVFLVGFMGCCGAIKEWRPLLVGYAIFLIIIMGMEVGTGIAVGVYQGEVTRVLKEELGEFLVHYSFVTNTVDDHGKIKLNETLVDTNTVQTAAMNALQAWVGCCGIDNYTDFKNSPYANYTYDHGSPLLPPPIFCCKFADPYTLRLSDAACGLEEKRTYQNISNFDLGCVPKITSLVDDNAPAIIGVAVGIGLIELIGIIFAFCLCSAIGKDKNKSKNYN